MNDIVDWVKDIAQRKNRKARQITFYRGLDEYAPRWEEINKMPDFIIWLNGNTLKTGKRIIDLVRDSYNDYDSYTVGCFYNYFIQNALSKKNKKEYYRNDYYRKGDLIGGKYEVFDILGEGGFGVVYLVYSQPADSVYALKTFRDEYLNDSQSRNLFRKEAQIWIDMEWHPNLVRAYLVDEMAGRLFIALEYVGVDEQGLNSLDGYLRLQPPDLIQSLRWAIQFCHGMEYAYLRGIRAHRDIKPANIMITQQKTVKISDFGLAGIIKKEESSGQSIASAKLINYTQMQTVAGTSLGTPEYMSPEHFSDYSVCDERSDLYSFGIVLYQMVSGGKLPFSADNSKYRWAVLKHYHCKKDIPTLDTPLLSIIMKCLNKEAKYRYQSFKELRAALEIILHARTGDVVSQPESLEIKWWEWGIKGKSLCVLGRHEEAISCYDKVLKVWQHKEVLLDKGNCLSHLERYEAAILCYDEIIRLDRNHSAAWINKAFCHKKLDKANDAFVCYDEALRIDPNDVMALNNKGFLLADVGRYDDAIACFAKLLEIDKVHIEAWFKRGFCLHMLKNYDAAIDCYDKVLEGNDQHLLAIINKGKCFHAQWQLAEALNCYDRAIEIDQVNYNAWYGKALCEDVLGQKQDAVYSFEQFTSLAPNQLVTEIEYARKKLHDLESDQH